MTVKELQNRLSILIADEPHIMNRQVYVLEGGLEILAEDVEYSKGDTGEYEGVLIS